MKNNPRKICILGGSGFVGRALLLQLARDGHKITVLTRHKDRQQNIVVYPNTTICEVDVYDEKALKAQFAQHDTIINLIGILHQGRLSKKTSFAHVHVNLIQSICRACVDSNINRLIHVSAINADQLTANSAYLKSKGQAEGILITHIPRNINVTIFRPSVIYGAEDSFVNRFANLLKLPLLPLACSQSKMAPIAVQDVAKIISLSLDMPKTFGQRYDLCGDEVFSLQEILKLIKEHRQEATLIVPLNSFLSKIMGVIGGLTPGKPFTLDNYHSLQQPAVCSDNNAFAYKPTGKFSADLKAILDKDATVLQYNKLRKTSGR